MNQRSLTVFSVMLSVILILSILSNGLAHQIQKVKTIVIIKEKNDPVFLTSEQRITYFINQLMTPKSARCFRNILNKESHMNPKAKNPNSSAKGVGQLLDSTYANIGLKHSTDPLSQVIASIAYISRHYGDTCKAWAFWQRHSYY